MSLSKESKELLAECYGSTRKTAEYLFPGLFSRCWTDLHLQIFDLLDNSDNPKKAIIAPRGIGKTTIANILLPAKAGLFLRHKYIVPVSCTSTAAVQQSENLKAAVINNRTIKKLFGNVSGSTLNKEQWLLQIGGAAGAEVCIMPRGAGQQVRGMLYRGSRMQLGIADDLEDPEHMDSEEMRAKKKNWFYNDFMKAVDNYERPVRWELIVANTLLHEDSLAADILSSPDWDTLELEICDDDFVSKIPEWLSDDEIKEVYEEEVRRNNIEGFYREYRNKPNVGGKDASFTSRYFKYYKEADHVFAGPDIETFVIVDPAKTANVKSAETAAVGATVNYRTNEIYIRDIVHGRWHPDEIIAESIAMVKRLNAGVFAVETTGVNEWASYPIKNELVRQGLFVHFEELHSRGGGAEKAKKSRIKTLVPFYRLGLVKHNRNNCAPLEAQLLSFPNAKYWDVMDAAGYIPQLLERSERFMLPLDVFDGLLPEEHSVYSEGQAEEEMSIIMNGYDDSEKKAVKMGMLI